jgi:acyl-CoA thioesterase FadM
MSAVERAGENVEGAGARALGADGYRFVDPVAPRADDFDGQGHLNNASTVRLFNDMRIAYVHGKVGSWWPEAIRANGFVIAAREVHVLYESEGRPGERFVGGMKYVGREGKAAVLEQRIVEAGAGRPIARAWVVQLLVQQGKVVEWPARYFDRVAEIEGHVLPARPRAAPKPWGPNHWGPNHWGPNHWGPNHWGPTP